MSGALLEQRGRTRTVAGHVTGCAFDRADRLVGFVTGEGSVHMTPRDGQDWTDVAAHDGAILSLAADVVAGGFLTGGDDGVLNRVSNEAVAIGSFGGRWVDGVAASFGLIAAAVGKRVLLMSAQGAVLKTLEHPSTVTGVVFDAKGKRVAASHYNGVSLWFVASRSDVPRLLEWKGSHIAVAIHPGGEAVVSSMQENALHGWRLSDGHNMRMSGYPTKTVSLSFSRTGKWLATSGAEAVVLWPFFGGGPMGKVPLELGAGTGAVCTRVVCHPSKDMLAAGFADGSVLIADVGTERLLPVCAAAGSPVSALAWSGDGATLAFGTQAGQASVVDLGKR